MAMTESHGAIVLRIWVLAYLIPLRGLSLDRTDFIHRSNGRGAGVAADVRTQVARLSRSRHDERRVENVMYTSGFSYLHKQRRFAFSQSVPARRDRPL